MRVRKTKKQLKVSHYTHVFSYPDGLHLAYNTLTGSLIQLNDEAGSRIETLLTPSRESPQEDRPETEMLARLGFLVDGDIDELNVVREIFRRGRHKQGEAMLTILPTLGCNFGCPYCFEKHIKGLMSPEVQEALLKFVRTSLLPKSRGLSIEWFGGEPLLGISVIESLTRSFRQACHEKGFSGPTGSITTNGYLLTPETTARLIGLGVTSAQVTFDGPPEVHNRRRPLAGGLGSFDKILANLKTIPPEFEVSIRINVDAGNRDCVFDLLTLLRDEGVIPRATPYVAKVESFSEECRSSEGIFLTSEQFGQFKTELRARCLEAGIPWFSSDPPRLAAYGFCIVDQPKGFVVQPDGKLLKCWAEAGNSTGTPVAHLLDEKTWNHMACSPLQSRDPFDDEECCQCKILPACMGGCPRIRQSLRQEGIKRCPTLRYSLPDDVRALHFRETHKIAPEQSSAPPSALLPILR